MDRRRARDNEEEEDDLTGLFVGAGAVVGGLALLGYGAYKLASRGQVEERQPKVRGAPALRFPEPGDEQNHDSEEDIPERHAVTQGPAVTLSERLGQLEKDINQQTYGTDIERERKALVQWFVQEFIYKYLEDEHAETFYTGSSYELTSIPPSSDYDIQFCLKIPRDSPTYRKPQVLPCGEPGWAKIRGGPQKLLDNNGFLSAAKARKMLLRKLDSALTNDLFYNGNPVHITRQAYRGPATSVTIKLSEHDELKVEVDIVMCVRNSDLSDDLNAGMDYVAKPFNNEDDYPERWRVSYSRKEKDLLRSYDTNPGDKRRALMLLRIMKYIKKKNAQLNHFSSFFFKNILFKLVEKEFPDSESWGPRMMAERFKDMVRLMSDALQVGFLPVYFDPQVNCLQRFDPKKIREVGDYLARIIRQDRYIELCPK